MDSPIPRPADFIRSALPERSDSSLTLGTARFLQPALATSGVPPKLDVHALGTKPITWLYAAFLRVVALALRAGLATAVHADLAHRTLPVARLGLLDTFPQIPVVCERRLRCARVAPRRRGRRLRVRRLVFLCNQVAIGHE